MFNGLAVLSLVLCVAMVGLWVASYLIPFGLLQWTYFPVAPIRNGPTTERLTVLVIRDGGLRIARSHKTLTGYFDETQAGWHAVALSNPNRGWLPEGLDLP
jgi:hypothetical protein